jgi:hypothetical protein
MGGWASTYVVLTIAWDIFSFTDDLVSGQVKSPVKGSPPPGTTAQSVAGGVGSTAGGSVQLTEGTL